MLLARVLARVVGEGQLTIIDETGRSHRIEGATARPGRHAANSYPVDRRAAGAQSRLALGEAYMDGTLTVERRRHLRPARSPGPQHRGTRSHADGALVLHLAALATRARAVQSDRQGAAQRRAPLRPDGPALRSLPRPRPAVFLRLFQDRRGAARAGAARQEAPHRGQAAARSPARACSTSARAGAAWALFLASSSAST